MPATLLQWHGHGGDWQKWNYDAETGLIRNKHDPNYCLDNMGIFENGANIIIWACNGKDEQRFVLNGDGSIGVRVSPQQVIDGYGTDAGDGVGTWSNWGGANQRWSMVP